MILVRPAVRDVREGTLRGAGLHLCGTTSILGRLFEMKPGKLGQSSRLVGAWYILYDRLHKKKNTHTYYHDVDAPPTPRTSTNAPSVRAATPHCRTH